MLGELQKEFHFRQQHPEPSPSVTKGQQRQAKKLISNVNGQQVVMEHILHKEGEEPKMFMVTVYKYGPK